MESSSSSVDSSKNPNAQQQQQPSPPLSPEQLKDAEVTVATTVVPPMKPNFRKDLQHIFLLFFLYILQGIPLGLIQTIPFLLQSSGVSYQEQAKFSLAFWPFSLKVLYAPIVDSVYWQRLGRRKSWLIPLQYLIALFLLILSFKVDVFFATKDITILTIMFFLLNFLAASQDVAVDGWALTMLSPENVGYASTCNAVGQTLGIVFGYSVFLALDSVSFANKLRSEPGTTGLVTLSQYLLFWSIIFGLTTTLILIFKKEKEESSEVQDGHMDILKSYKNLWSILKLRNIQLLAILFLTVKIGSAATDGLTRLKLVENGVPKETLAFYSIPLIPIKFLLPLITAKWTAGSQPLKLYTFLIPISYLFGIIHPLVLLWSSSFKSTSDGELSLVFYFILFGVFALELIPNYIRFVASMGFAAQVSDPAIGGTYMTLINTINNIGSMWPTSLVLWLVDYVGICFDNFTSCSTKNTTGVGYVNTTKYIHYNVTDKLTVNGTSQIYESTKGATGIWSCSSGLNGYYVLSICCVSLGFIWLLWGRPTALRLQNKPRDSWRVVIPLKS